jgi:hypothetical protein
VANRGPRRIRGKVEDWKGKYAEHLGRFTYVLDCNPVTPDSECGRHHYMDEQFVQSDRIDLARLRFAERRRHGDHRGEREFGELYCECEQPRK